VIVLFPPLGNYLSQNNILGAKTGVEIYQVSDSQIIQINPEKLFDYHFKAKAHPFSIITSHHLLAKHLINSTYKSIDFKPKRIIIFGPNHFNVGQHNIQTSNVDWSINGKRIISDQQSLEKLIDDSIKVENENFRSEHAFTSQLPFIAYYFPEAKIIPIIVKNSTPAIQAEALGEKLTKFIDRQTLVILSVDFSHESLPKTAAIRDKDSLDVLGKNSLNKVYKIHIDSAPGLYALMSAQNKLHIKKFQLFKNTNSGYLTKHNNQFDATSYIFGAYLH
jgi:hypothetical protein